jgi:NAD(P)H dehydrogenase (quinone)
MAEYAADLAELSGKAVLYQDMPGAEYAKVLVQAGLPDAFAATGELQCLCR